MDVALWSAIVGLLLVVMALGDSVLARLPLSTSMLYLAVGVAVSPIGFALSRVEPAAHAALLEHLAEFVLLLSLFTAGMKMSVGLGDGRWLLPLRLAVASMLVTVAAIAAFGVGWLGLPLGAAVLLGGILAPTDPVLAAEVELEHAGDRDRLRFSLTGEAGLNDGTATPLVLLGLGLLGLHDIGAGGWRWAAVDVIWGAACGLGVGAALGTAVARLVLYLRRKHQEATGLDNFLALGLIALSYGITQLAHGIGFLAVFAAGVALRRIEQSETRAATAAAAPAAAAAADRARPQRRESDATAAGGAAEPARTDAGAATDAAAAPAPGDVAELAAADPDTSRAEQVAVHPQHAPAYLAHAVSSFNEQLGRIGEVGTVILVGMLLWAVDWSRASVVFVVLLLVVIRPVSVAIGLARSATSTTQRRLIGWFGIRGIGSLYYVMYAISHGLAPDLAQTLLALTLSVVVASIALHGISVTPLMARYRRPNGRARPRE